MKNELLMGILLFSMFLNVNMRNADAANAYQGYTFYASGTYSYLVDMSGTVLHTWKASGSAVCVAYLLEDGSVLVPINNNWFIRIRWGTSSWTYSENKLGR